MLEALSFPAARHQEIFLSHKSTASCSCVCNSRLPEPLWEQSVMELTEAFSGGWVTWQSRC